MGNGQAGQAFGAALRARRLEMVDPETGRKPISQERLSLLLSLSENCIGNYERGLRVPHPLVRRELERVFPGLFASTR